MDDVYCGDGSLLDSGRLWCVRELGRNRGVREWTEEGGESTEDGGETSVEEGGETSTEEGGAVSEGEGSANESSCVEAFECFVNTAPEEQDDALFLCVPSELPEDALLSYVNLVHCVTDNCPEDMGPNGAECWIEFCQENLDACYENTIEED